MLLVSLELFLEKDLELSFHSLLLIHRMQILLQPRGQIELVMHLLLLLRVQYLQ